MTDVVEHISTMMNSRSTQCRRTINSQRRGGQGHIISRRGAGREQLGIDWAVKMGTQRSRLAEYVVRPNSAPHDVGFARLDLVAVLECRPAIGSQVNSKTPGAPWTLLTRRRLRN